MAMFGKKKHSQMIVAPGGTNSITYLVPFKPKELIAAFVIENQAGFPACHPIPTDQVTAEVVDYGLQGTYGVKVTWTAAGDRAISVVAKNYIG